MSSPGSIQVYNTLTRAKQAFVPLRAGHVGMYVCGPTVYDDCHIGHLMGPVLFDAVAVLPSAEGGAQLALEAAAVNFVRDAFGHLKVIAYLPTAAPLFVKGGLSDATPDSDPGLVALPSASLEDFVTKAAQGRVWGREPQVRRIF